METQKISLPSPTPEIAKTVREQAEAVLKQRDETLGERHWEALMRVRRIAEDDGVKANREWIKLSGEYILRSHGAFDWVQKRLIESLGVMGAEEETLEGKQEILTILARSFLDRSAKWREERHSLPMEAMMGVVESIEGIAQDPQKQEVVLTVVRSLGEYARRDDSGKKGKRLIIGRDFMRACQKEAIELLVRMGQKKEMPTKIKEEIVEQLGAVLLERRARWIPDTHDTPIRGIVEVVDSIVVEGAGSDEEKVVQKAIKILGEYRVKSSATGHIRGYDYVPASQRLAGEMIDYLALTAGISNFQELSSQNEDKGE